MPPEKKMKTKTQIENEAKRAAAIAAARPIIKASIKEGLSSNKTLEKLKAAGIEIRRQDAQAQVRQISQKPKAAYNIGGAKRADVKKPQVEKYIKKAAKKKAKQAAPASSKKSKKRTKSHGKKHKRKTPAGPGAISDEEHYEGDVPGKGKKSAKRTGLDVTAHFTGDSPDLKKIKAELQRHGIKFFDSKDRRELVLAKDKESGNVHLYGTAVYEADKDQGGRVTGLTRVLLNKALKRLGQATL